MVSYIDASYTETSSNFIQMLLFGIKHDYSLQNKINFLNIAQLFVVSGLHLQVFVNVTKKIIKNKKINISITLMILFCNE